MAKQRRNLRSAKTVYLTPHGLEQARSELSFLKKDKRAQIVERIQRAIEFGDLTENSEYDAALEEQVLVETRIATLEEVLNNAKIIVEGPKNDFVVIGSTVIVDIDGSVDEFTIVGRVEADPVKKKISNESPLGSALLGAKVGETVEVVAPIVKYKCKVLKIR